MKMEWIEYPMEHDAYSLRINNEDMDVVIYKPYEHTGEDWYLYCTILNINGENLKTENFDEAVAKAQKIIDKKLNEIYFRLREFTLNVGKNVMVKY